MFHAGTKTGHQCYQKLCTSTFAYVTNTETTQNVAFRQREACRVWKRWKTLWKGASMAAFLLPYLVLLLTATELRWVVAQINTKFIFYFQGICSWARDLELWQLDRGVQLCGGGEKCLQGVETRHKVGWKWLFKLSPFDFPRVECHTDLNLI